MSSNRPKQYEVIKRTRREIDGVTVGGRKLKFGHGGMFTTGDPGIARELQKYHKNDVVVAEVDKPKSRGDVSRSFFGSMPEMPWKTPKRKPGRRAGQARR